MKNIKVEIHQKNEDFVNEVYEFLQKKSFDFKRQTRIDSITSSEDRISKSEYIKNLSPISLESVYGSTYQSSIRDNSQIYSISHTIKSIEFEENSFYATLEPSNYGEIIDFKRGKLRPVYYRPEDEDKLIIATFDIDFNISN